MRIIVVAALFALAAAAQAQPDPSNPAAAPLTPSHDEANQPTRAEVPSSALPADARAAMEKTPPLTGAAAEAAEAEAARQARVAEPAKRAVAPRP